MAVIQSKLKSGTLTIGAEEYACQATNVQVVPAHADGGDALETLCGDLAEGDTTRTDSLKITAIQDFDDDGGFTRYSWLHDGQIVTFSWKPSASGPTFSGSVKVKALPVGGNVNERLTHDAEWAVIGPVVWTPAV